MLVVSKVHAWQGLDESCLPTVSQLNRVGPENVGLLNVILSSTETTRTHHTSRGACQRIKGVLLRSLY